MMRSIIFIASILAVSVASFLPSFGSNNAAAFNQLLTPLNQASMSNEVAFSNMANTFRADPMCGGADFTCTAPAILSSASPTASFGSGYKKLVVSGMGASPRIYISRSDGYWVGRAGDGGCAAFGGYSGGAPSKIGFYGGDTGTVVAFACK